jgi:hypothetical protein
MRGGVAGIFWEEEEEEEEEYGEELLVLTYLHLPTEILYQQFHQ